MQILLERLTYRCYMSLSPQKAKSAADKVLLIVVIKIVANLVATEMIFICMMQFLIDTLWSLSQGQLSKIQFHAQSYGIDKMKVVAFLGFNGIKFEL